MDLMSTPERVQTLPVRSDNLTKNFLPHEVTPTTRTDPATGTDNRGLSHPKTWANVISADSLAPYTPSPLENAGTPGGQYRIRTSNRGYGGVRDGGDGRPESVRGISTLVRHT